MDWIQTILLALVLFLLLTWFTGIKPKGMPDGPMGLPLVGYYPFLGKVPYVTMMNLAKKYGPMYTLPLFDKRTVVLNDWKSVKEALIQQSDVFSGRPPQIVSEFVHHNSDITFTRGGVTWRERRRFTLQHLRDFGFGKKTMEGVIMEEVNILSERLKTFHDQKISVDNLFFFSMLNIIWTVVGGKRFEPNDSYMKEFIEVLDIIFDGMTTSHIANVTPLLRFLPGSGFQKFIKANRKLYDFIDVEIQEHMETYQEGHDRDLIDVYLAELKRQEKLSELDPVSARSFQRKNMNSIMWNMFIAGIDTGSNTMSWALLYMVTWPEIQQKVQRELDEVIGRARLPTYEDCSMLPYTMAVLFEVLRYSSFVPLSVLHYTLAPAKLFEYTIPKSTLIYENIYAVHFDSQYWGDPEVFRPERFLNDEGKVFQPEYFIPFSVGGRVCLGEPLARMEIFLFFACLLHQFSFFTVTGEKPPILDPQIRITLKPEPFSLMIKQR